MVQTRSSADAEGPRDAFCNSKQQVTFKLSPTVLEILSLISQNFKRSRDSEHAYHGCSARAKRTLFFCEKCAHFNALYFVNAIYIFPRRT